MGIYLNPGNEGFRNIIAGKYVDKTGLIALMNDTLNTSDKLTCVSRPRRFGKSFSAKMLAAYYDKSCDSSELFEGLKIAALPSYEKYRNKFNVIYLDVTDFISTALNPSDIVTSIRESLRGELKQAFSNVSSARTLGMAFVAAYEEVGEKFFFIIDEWDALFREFPKEEKLLKEYVNFLRELFKNGNITDKVMAGAYMTGILPIKKYGTQSAISDFIEYTMISPGKFAGYIGFVEEEVRALCEKEGISYDLARKWYDGYYFDGVGSVYNPSSLMSAIRKGTFANYWGKTETYESIVPYIEMDFDGLKQSLISLLGAGKVFTDVDSYQNDMTSIKNKDDVLSLLVHLGYLGYHAEDKTVYVPNEEARQELLRAVQNSNRKELVELIRLSDHILKSTIDGNAEVVGNVISRIHDMVPPLFYNDEQSLRYVIRFAYLTAIDSYVRIEELPSGHGFADIVFLPKKNADRPAILIELKWNKPVDSAIQQIKEKKYPALLKEYGEDFLLVGIMYDTETKEHVCAIERGAV